MESDFDESGTDMGMVADADTKSAVDLLPHMVLERSLGKNVLERMAGEGSFCLVVQVPDETWVEPIGRSLRRMFEFSARITSREKPRRPEKETAAMVARYLSDGEKVFGVSQDPYNMLPQVLVSSSDLFVVLPQPDAELLGDVVKAVTGEAVALEPKSCRGLTFAEIVTSIRQGSTALQCSERLRSVSAKRIAQTSIAGAAVVDDLIGYGEAKAWAQNLVQDLMAWRSGDADFDTIESRAVLAGPPGTGKTTFAKSVAHTAGIPMFATSAAAWFLNGPGHLDSVIKEIDAVFAAARAEAPAMVFIDELDAVPDRRTLSPRGRDWWLPVVVHLLTLLDGASASNRNLVIVGATNYPDRLDDALIRPGRLSRLIHIGVPAENELRQILRHHLKDELQDADLGLATVLMPGATGADAAEIVKRARALARRQNRSIVIDDLISILTPPDTRPTSLRERIGVHEAGHAVVAHVTGSGRLRSISMIPNGRVGGAVSFEHEGSLPTRQDVEKSILQLLGGRAAEKILLGSIGTGSGGMADSDLAQATMRLAMLHASQGLGSTLAYRGGMESMGSLLQLDATFTRTIDAELQSLHQQAEAIIAAHIETTRAVADALVASRYLTRDEFVRIVEAHGGIDASR